MSTEREIRPEAADDGASEPAERQSLAREVHAALKRRIFDFSMAPGQRYSEHELAAELSVSRTPMRLALHLLAHEGFVINVGGHSAWQVRRLDLSYYEDLYDFRVEIEALAVRRLVTSGPLPALDELGAFWRAPQAGAADNAAVAQRDEEFHRTLVASSGNRAMLRTFDDLTERIRVIRRLDFVSPERISATFSDHARILDAIEAGDAAKAERLVRSHIETSRSEIRKFTLHHMALATPAPLQARGAGRKPAKAARA